LGSTFHQFVEFAFRMRLLSLADSRCMGERMMTITPSGHTK